MTAKKQKVSQTYTHCKNQTVLPQVLVKVRAKGHSHQHLVLLFAITDTYVTGNLWSKAFHEMPKMSGISWSGENL